MRGTEGNEEEQDNTPHKCRVNNGQTLRRLPLVPRVVLVATRNYYLDVFCFLRRPSPGQLLNYLHSTPVMIHIPPPTDPYWNVPLLVTRFVVWNNLRRMDQRKKQKKQQKHNKTTKNDKRLRGHAGINHPPHLTGCPYGCVTGLPCPVAYVVSLEHTNHPSLSFD